MNMPAPGFYAPAADRYAHMRHSTRAAPTSIWQTTTALAPARQKKRWGKLWTATCVRTATS